MPNKIFEIYDARNSTTISIHEVTTPWGARVLQVREDEQLLRVFLTFIEAREWAFMYRDMKPGNKIVPYIDRKWKHA